MRPSALSPCTLARSILRGPLPNQRPPVRGQQRDKERNQEAEGEENEEEDSDNHGVFYAEGGHGPAGVRGLRFKHHAPEECGGAFVIP